MTEVNYILTTMTSRSLIIIDELCRSTSIEEGTSIAMAICEDLARSGAYTYVTTHFALLTKLADLFVNIKVWQMQTIPSGDPKYPKTMKLDYKFNLVPGPTTLRGYGIYMVRNIWPPEVLHYVDEFQAQLTQATKNPEFPSIDRRVRLKYELECKLAKLKFQKKLTVANLNKHINKYNDEMKKIGEAPHNSQIMFQDLHSTSGHEGGLDHSIFDVSKNNAPYECPEFEQSKIYLNGMEENKDSFHDAFQPELSPIYPNDEETNIDEEMIVLSPMSTQDSLQTPITSPTKAKRRMQKIFTPDTNLESFQSQSTYHSVNSDQYFGLLAPEVHLSYSASNCSLNLTKNALSLEEDAYIQVKSAAEDPQITNTQNNVYELQNQQDYSDHERLRNQFNESQSVRSPLNSLVASQVSSCDLSQQLEMIRKQRRNLTSPKETLHPLPGLPSELTLINSEIESPFLNTFMRPLQSDITKTSTPLIRKIECNARNFGSSSASTRTSVQNSTENMTRPKISYTILSGVHDVDMQSVQEDLESFIEDMQNEGTTYFHSEEDVTSAKEKHNLFITEEGNRNIEDEILHEKNKSIPVENNDSEQVNVYQKAPKHKSINFFPAVTVIEGPNDTTFEENSNNCAFDDKETVVKPIVRNPQHQPTNQEQEDVLINAFNSLSEKKYPILPQNTDNNANNEKNNGNETECHVNASLVNENYNVDVEQRDFTSKNKAVDEENTENNVEVETLIKAFNSISKTRETGVVSSKNKHIENVNSLEEFGESARHVDARKQEVKMKQIHTSHEVHKYSDNLLYENKMKHNISKEIEENTMMECYQSAQSSQGTSYSKEAFSDDTHKFTNQGNNGRSNESRNTDIPNNECSNMSDICKSSLQEASDLSISDYNRTTQQMSHFRYNSREQEGTDTEKYIQTQKNLSESNYDTASSQETQCNNKRKSNFYGNLLVESDSSSNYEDAVTNPQGVHTDTNNAQKKNRKKKRQSKAHRKICVDSAIQSYSGCVTKSNSPETDHNLKTNDVNSDMKNLQQQIQCNKYIPSDVGSNLLEYMESKNLSESNCGSSSDNARKLKAVTSGLNKAVGTSNNDKSNFNKNLSIDSDNFLGPGDAKRLNDDTALKSTAIDVEEPSTDHSRSTYVSVTDVIQTIDEETPNLNRNKVDECKDALQKKDELIEKILHMTDKTLENLKNKEIVLNNNDNVTQHIPYLSAYSNSSLNSNKGNKEVSKDSFTVNLKEANTSQRKKRYSRKRTLGIARHRQSFNELKLRKKSHKSSDQQIIDQENIPQKEGTHTTHTISEENKDKGSVKNVSTEKDAKKKSNKSLEKTKPEEVTDTGLEQNKTTTILSTNNSRSLKRKKRKKLSQNQSTLFLADCTQNRPVEEKTITSISEASKLRNLEGDYTSSSSGGKKFSLKNAPGNGDDCDERFNERQHDKTVTSISEASRKRNLDQSTFSSSDKRQSQNGIHQEPEKSSSGLIFSENAIRTQSRKSRMPGKKPIAQGSDECMVAHTANSFINDALGSVKADTTKTQDQTKLRFPKSPKLSKKTIQEAFYEQDKKFFESSGSSTDLAKMWEQRLRRPTMRQIQGRTCVATLRKTEEGVEVIPEKKKKRKLTKKKNILSSSNNSVNMNIFSDKNAKTFDLFIKSDTKDFKSFNFNFGHGATSTNDGKMFDFTQTSLMPPGYNQNRNLSENFLSMSQQSSHNLPFLTQNADFSLTPEGFYKQNRDDIGQLLRKYN